MFGSFLVVTSVPPLSPFAAPERVLTASKVCMELALTAWCVGLYFSNVHYVMCGHASSSVLSAFA